MKGINLIDFIQRNHLEDATVVVTATVYRQGDHDCTTTDQVTLMDGSFYDREQKKYIPSVVLYVDDNL